MAQLNRIFQLLIDIFNGHTRDIGTGAYSEWVNTPHPGTNNAITGWEWGVRSWPESVENLQELVIPRLFDAPTNNVPDGYFQSGTGDNNDLEVDDIVEIAVSGVNKYAGLVNHGYYYIHKDQHYLFADTFRTQYFVTNDLSPGNTNALTLQEFPKPGIPLYINTWVYDRVHGDYDIDLSFRKKIDFSGKKQDDGSRLITRSGEILWGNVDSSRPEFLVEYTISGVQNTATPPEILLNSVWTKEIGVEVITSGDLSLLDQLGETTGADYQELHTTYSPIDSTRTVQIYSYPSYSGVWTYWSGVQSSPSVYQTEVDHDLGIIRFGKANEPTLTPPAGMLIGAHYTTTPAVIYEPLNTPDVVLPTEQSANINPIHRTSHKGFLFLRREPSDPVSIELFADLPLIQTDLYGPMSIGGNYALLHAIVRDSRGMRVEGIPVIFYFTSQQHVGSFSGATTSVTSISDSDGIATAIYNPPLTVQDISHLTGVVDAGPPGEITVSGITLESALSEIYLYKVFKDDLALGSQYDIETETSYWTAFFTEEGIEGPTGLDDPAIAGQPERVWELRRRILTELLTPRFYRRALFNGRKQIVAVWDEDGINPHTGFDGAFVPLQPTSYSQVGNDTVLEFTGTTLDIPSGSFDAYMVVAPQAVSIQTSCFNERLQQTIISNEITIQLTVPPHLNGTVFIDDINDLPTDLVSWTLTSAHEGRTLPLGFRVRSAGTTIAGALGGVTYLDINQTLASGVDLFRRSLPMAFTVGSGVID